MIDINALKTSLYNSISVAITTYDAEADQDADYPYAVYKLPSSFNGNKDNNQNIHFTMEIDIWDQKRDASDIDHHCSVIDNTLSGSHVITEAFYYSLERISPYMTIPDPRTDIQHRQIRYLVKVQFV